MAVHHEHFVSGDLKVRGGTAVNRMRKYPVAAFLGAVLTAAPFAALTGAAEGPVAGLFMGLIGLVVGAPVGAMIAEDASA
jgi:hypothetical protein